MSGIYILKGTGTNCTCSDCSVLYGGKCLSSGDNDLLDKMEVMIAKKLDKDISKSKIESMIYDFKPLIVKHLKLKKASDFEECFYCFVPLIYFMTSRLREEGMRSKRADKYNLNRLYRRTRWYLFLDVYSQYRKLYGDTSN